MTYSVFLSIEAESNVIAIYDWLAIRSPSGADSWYAAFLESLDHLESDPIRFGLAPESAFFSNEIRQQLFKTRKGRYYRVLFSVRDNVVNVLYVRGPGQQLIS